MPFKIAEARKTLQAFDLKKLFIEEMGWDNPGSDLVIRFSGQNIKLKAVAQKRGFGVFVVPPVDGKMPDYAARRKVETEVRKSVHEHILIFTDSNGHAQKWQWVRREPNKPTTAREFEFSKGQSGDPLLYRLEKMFFSMDEEGKVGGITYAANRVRSAFDVEKVTKKFYERFKDEHTAFMKFLKGIPDEHFQRWYVSVTLNRLMFVYFIQSKNFLDNDLKYLKNHLEASKQKGKDLFYTDFLCPLFFEGFAKKERTAKVKKLFGNIPYLNGGIFEQHQIEELYGEKIQIPDKAFDQLFEFFDGYRWHLDERVLKEGNEINPDVLGYIFEKYINQKQMGAYYTKEDITEYNSKNTIIPHIFDVAQKECKVAFTGEGSVWRHLQDDPDRYIYEALRYGAEIPLPPEIAIGESDPKRREGWNKAAPAEFALPTEIWREVIARRRRYQEVKEKLAGGLVTSINDLITLNLDIRQFAQDVIEDSDADLLTAFWHALSQIKILDPTVGSGAFLFAALNVLEPMYEACIERMRVLVKELDASGEKHSPKKYEHFRKALEQVNERPDEDYFIFKSIIINNLYGVDIMDEAVEICKLRLFLKLAAQVEVDPSKENLGIEPLPDIDFNIRAGNTLVGFATREDVKRSVEFGSVGGKQKVQSEKLFAMPEEENQLKLIEQKAEDVDRLYKIFRAQQTTYGGEVNADDKKKLEKKLKALDDELNILLARQYGIDKPKGEKYEEWLKSHQPFHWFVEFYGIMSEGGFDVIIGNPPYVEYKKNEKYSAIGYSTEDTGNLYSLVVERSTNLAKKTGKLGLIVMLNLTFSDGYESLRQLIAKRSQSSWVSLYDNIPDGLFASSAKSESENTNKVVSQRVCILISDLAPSKSPILFTSSFLRWNRSFRNFLFANLSYGQIEMLSSGTWASLGSSYAPSIYKKMQQIKNQLATYISLHGSEFLQLGATPRYFISAAPEELNRSGIVEIRFGNKNHRHLVECVLNSNLFYWVWRATGDGFHLTKKTIFKFPIPMSMLNDEKTFSKLVKDLENVRPQCRTSKLNKGKLAHNINYNRAPWVIDEIDRALARHYGLSDEELDFIINYDVKYRMGASAGEGEDE
jgi:hypothetical protein